MRKSNKKEAGEGKTSKKELNLRKLNQVERVTRFLDFLRKNTDINHTIKPKDINEAFEGRDLDIGAPNTLHDFVISLANALNFDERETILREDEWRIVFEAFVDEYSKGKAKECWHIKGLYYNPEFSYDDIDAMVEAIRFSRTMEPERADKLIDILENNFASKYYKQSPRHICKVYEAPVCERGMLKENLKIIQEAIDAGVQIEYRFNGYTGDKKIAPMGEYIRRASPYYLVSDNGKYYLIAANDRYSSAFILRVDLMSEVTIPRRKDGIGGVKRMAKRKVNGLPPVWDPEYPLSHYRMSYDTPEYITLRVHKPKAKDGRSINPAYTFLHDAFGDSYIVTGTDKNYDIVQVKCSPFGMVNFALQYSGKVEVLEPAHVREQVKERIKELTKKYKK